jgi:hypothetical protein
LLLTLVLLFIRIQIRIENAQATWEAGGSKCSNKNKTKNATESIYQNGLNLLFPSLVSFHLLPSLLSWPKPSLAFARLQQQRKRAKPRQKGHICFPRF